MSNQIERKAFTLRAVSAAIELLESSPTQLSRLVLRDLKRARAFLALDYPGSLSDSTSDRDVEANKLDEQ